MKSIVNYLAVVLFLIGIESCATVSAQKADGLEALRTELIQNIEDLSPSQRKTRQGAATVFVSHNSHKVEISFHYLESRDQRIERYVVAEDIRYKASNKDNYEKIKDAGRVLVFLNETVKTAKESEGLFWSLHQALRVLALWAFYISSFFSSAVTIKNIHQNS